MSECWHKVLYRSSTETEAVRFCTARLRATLNTAIRPKNEFIKVSILSSYKLVKIFSEHISIKLAFHIKWRHIKLHK